MTDDQVENQESVQRRQRTRKRLLTGTVLWVCCFVGLYWIWHQQQFRQSSLHSESVDESDDGRSTRQIKLIPQKDGSFSLTDVTASNGDSPWDADGIEDFSFTDTDGNTVTKKDLLGKPFIIAFVFTHCLGPCPSVTRQMREIQDRLKDLDFNLVTLTVDPERDTTEVLKKYGADQGANFNRWRFLTGNQADIYGLIQRSFKMPVEEAKGNNRVPGFEYVHSTNIMLVDATGKVVGKYNAAKKDEVEVEMSKLRKDLKRLVSTKSKTTNTKSEN